jgi:hypothetical protein
MKTVYEEIGEKLGQLVAEKNAAYGSAFDKSGEILRVLYPNGIRPDQYTDALGTIRVIDKLFRIATAKDAFGESPWQDIAGYGILGASRKENESRQISDKQHTKVDINIKKTPKGR